MSFWDWGFWQPVTQSIATVLFWLLVGIPLALILVRRIFSFLYHQHERSLKDHLAIIEQDAKALAFYRAAIYATTVFALVIFLIGVIR